ATGRLSPTGKLPRSRAGWRDGRYAGGRGCRGGASTLPRASPCAALGSSQVRVRTAAPRSSRSALPEAAGGQVAHRPVCSARARRPRRGVLRGVEPRMASYNDGQPVRHRPPPAALLRVLNPTVRASLGTPLWRLFPSWMAVLEFSGRRSRRQLRVPVGIHDVHGTPTVFTDRPWRLNFAAGAPV